jgi:hypothetical protein
MNDPDQRRAMEPASGTPEGPYHKLPPLQRFEYRVRGVQKMVNLHPEWHGSPISDQTVQMVLWLGEVLSQALPIETVHVRSDLDHSLNIDWEGGSLNILGSEKGGWTLKIQPAAPGGNDGPQENN